jgi:hypothetical protein
LAEADAARAAAAILDFDGSDHQHFALMTASAATGDRIVFAAAGDFSLIDLDQAGERTATERALRPSVAPPRLEYQSRYEKSGLGHDDPTALLVPGSGMGHELYLNNDRERSTAVVGEGSPDVGNWHISDQ